MILGSRRVFEDHLFFPRWWRPGDAALAITYPLQPFNDLTLHDSRGVSRSVRPRRPADDAERSEHDFHCQRAKDKSHDAHEDGRALPTDDPQNRV